MCSIKTDEKKNKPQKIFSQKKRINSIVPLFLIKFFFLSPFSKMKILCSQPYLVRSKKEIYNSFKNYLSPQTLILISAIRLVFHWLKTSIFFSPHSQEWIPIELFLSWLRLNLRDFKSFNPHSINYYPNQFLIQTPPPLP